MVTPAVAPVQMPSGVSSYAQSRLKLAWSLLGGVMDPEVPVVSIVELGIVRDVVEEENRLRVAITPTYSGCPAMDMIADDIRQVFDHERIAADVVRVLAPAWTTDWMAPEAKRRLLEFGIAPPHSPAAVRIDVAGISPLRRRNADVPCPQCGSTHTSLISQFGSTACKALYRCNDCREPFDLFKPH